MKNEGVFYDWRQLIKACLGKPCARQYRRIAFDVICVDKGIRQAFLFDYASLTPETLQQFSDNIFANHLVQTNLTVVGVGDDVFIVNINLLLKKLQHANDNVRLIDVSGHLRDPSLFDVKRSTCLVNTMLNILGTQLQPESGTERNTSKSRVVHLALPDDINQTTMFGFMLEYPLLYWYDTCSDQNCLDMVPLHVCKLTATMNSSDDAEHHKPCGNRSSASEPHIVSSFSFPEAVYRDVENLVKQWYENMSARFAVYSKFSDVTFEHSVVTLPSVSM